MYARKYIIILGICAIFYGTNVFTQAGNISIDSKELERRSTFKHAINICPIAPVFGIYAINYEYLINEKNGILFRIEYEDVPNSYTEANIKSNGMAYSINYRTHFKGEMNSAFAGVYARYRTYKGDGKSESTSFDFTLPSLTIGLNIGKRWVWNSGFNITASLGYGFQKEFRDSNPSNDEVDSYLDQLEEEYDFMSPLYGEISIGYAF